MESSQAIPKIPVAAIVAARLQRLNERTVEGTGIVAAIGTAEARRYNSVASVPAGTAESEPAEPVPAGAAATGLTGIAAAGPAGTAVLEARFRVSAEWMPQTPRSSLPALVCVATVLLSALVKLAQEDSSFAGLHPCLVLLWMSRAPWSVSQNGPCSLPIVAGAAALQRVHHVLLQHGALRMLAGPFGTSCPH